jgi:nicotinamidase/pyrazinamidase
VKALVIIDVQNDLCPGGTLPVPDGDRVIPAINRIQPAFELVVATQDWHPSDHDSFAVNHPGHRPGDEIVLAGLPQILWPVHCVRDSPGAELHPHLDQSRIARIFRKGVDAAIDSYSGFFDNAHRRATGLDDYLKAHGVTAVYICGLATDYCVRFTAFDAVSLGYETHVIEDACRGVELRDGDIERAIRGMSRRGVLIEASTSMIIR